MGSHFVKFPYDKQAAAEAYLQWVCEPARNPFYPDPWSEVRADAEGNWIVGYVGPPWECPLGVIYPAPDGTEEMIAEGTIVPRVIWPEEE